MADEVSVCVSTLDVVPVEILEHIFGCLPHDDLKQLSGTSRALRILAASFLFQSISISDDCSKLKALAESHLGTALSNSVLNNVKQATIGSVDYDRFSEIDLLMLKCLIAAAKPFAQSFVVLAHSMPNLQALAVLPPPKLLAWIAKAFARNPFELPAVRHLATSHACQFLLPACPAIEVLDVRSERLEESYAARSRNIVAFIKEAGRLERLHTFLLHRGGGLPVLRQLRTLANRAHTLGLPRPHAIPYNVQMSPEEDASCLTLI